MQLETGNIVIDLERWSQKYLEEKINAGCKERTLEIYRGILEDFIEYSRQYQGEAGVGDINRIFINGYLAEHTKTARKFSSSSKKLYISVLKSFFLFLTENNDSNVDFEKVFQKLTVARELKVKPRIEEEEITKLLNFLEREKSAPRNRILNYRNALLIKIMLYGGLREHELIPIRLKDFIFHNSTENSTEYYSLLVLGKGNKERYVYIPADTVRDEIETLIECQNVDWRICSTRNGTIINRSNLWSIVTGIYQRAGIDKSGLHILRHTFARRLVSNDVNLETIRELLGHASIAVTAQYYAKTDEKNKRAAVMGVHENGR